ncbi:MAG: hypothetical protein NWE79_07255 [Candidatus Bathyarchaeota archaeon]|nr:hypothetical protein [Candidatus Bathyarchaeota archaeon]
MFSVIRLSWKMAITLAFSLILGRTSNSPLRGVEEGFSAMRRSNSSLNIGPASM